MYLLPAIDILGGKAVRLAKGDYNQVTVYNDDPVAQARVFEQAGAQWVHVVDLDGARSGVPENIAIVERIVRETSLSVEIGGGIRSLETLKRLAPVAESIEGVITGRAVYEGTLDVVEGVSLCASLTAARS